MRTHLLSITLRWEGGTKIWVIFVGCALSFIQVLLFLFVLYSCVGDICGMCFEFYSCFILFVLCACVGDICGMCFEFYSCFIISFCFMCMCG